MQDTSRTPLLDRIREPADLRLLSDGDLRDQRLYEE